MDRNKPKSSEQLPKTLEVPQRSKVITVRSHYFSTKWVEQNTIEDTKS